MKKARWVIGGILLLGICAGMMQTCMDHRRRKAPNQSNTPTFPDPPAPPDAPTAQAVE